VTLNPPPTVNPSLNPCYCHVNHVHTNRLASADNDHHTSRYRSTLCDPRTCTFLLRIILSTSILLPKNSCGEFDAVFVGHVGLEVEKCTLRVSMISLVGVTAIQLEYWMKSRIPSRVTYGQRRSDSSNHNLHYLVSISKRCRHWQPFRFDATMKRPCLT